MKLLIFVNPSRLRRWHLTLAEKATAAGHRVALAFAEGGPTLPMTLSALMGFERLVYGIPGGRASERLAFDHFAGLTGVMADADAVLDLTTIGAAYAPDHARTHRLRLLFDGVPDERAAIQAVANGRQPHLSVENDARCCLFEGVPAVEHPLFMSLCLDDIFTRAVTIILKALDLLEAVDDVQREQPRQSAAVVRPLAPLMLSFGVSTFVNRLSEKLGMIKPKRQHWRIGWRSIPGPGEDVVESGRWAPDAYRWLGDDGGRFYADPFPFEHEGKTYVFCEELESKGKGIISVFRLDADGTPSSPQTVLRTPYHLSYPQVFERDGEIWMIPETSANRTIELYRAVEFPLRWELDSVLVSDADASDATLLDYGGKLWLFATDKSGGLSWDTLCIWHADRLKGPWVAHRQNPVLIDAGAARPAGCFILHEGRLLRPAQDCRGVYGKALVFKEVTSLGEDHFEERILDADEAASLFRMGGIHTFNRSERFELIDRLVTRNAM